MYRFANGDEYEGAYKDDRRHGKGVLRYASDESEVDLKVNNARRCGKGDVYDGDWQDGMKCGTGICRYANGDVYIGDWEDDKIDGMVFFHRIYQFFKCDFLWLLLFTPLLGGFTLL